MSEAISTTALRANLYRLLDQVLEENRPLRIRRGNRLLVIYPEPDTNRRDLSKLPRRQATTCTPDELVEQSFEDSWSGEL